ncbi:MAG: 2,3-bisphosphoglycerate-independent phosphoglycerate mutase, partial [Flammeovirgaceae bacterium]|nr:2,3-bisphosphoglycerate-independent phosphoglycerate mutase [Flammeovirgaceae bacterium]
DSLYEKYAHSKLQACGLAVGLPEGQMGNSEVGHMNIGAGRVVYQMLVRINKAVKEKTLGKNEGLVKAFEYAKANNKKVHFTGLVSDGGVHSHIEHLKGLITAASDFGLSDVFVHAFTDGRDCAPDSGIKFIKELEGHITKNTGAIASVTGRYFAMDRDKRWERVKLAYDAMVKGEGKKVTSIEKAVQESYDEGVTDEFIKPIVKVDESGNPVGNMEDGDVVLCFNFRTDRGREITIALTQEAFPEQEMKPLNLYYMTMTQYDETYKNVHVLFSNKNLENTLGEVLARNGKKQIRIAETEKYPHVTFFFSGGEEEPFEGETRLMCPSPKVATYDLQPEMSASDIRDKIVPELNAKSADFICLNFANPDMVGHTGVFEAAVKACETVDHCAKSVIEAATKNGYTTIVIADHGNSDIMRNPDGSPHTAHTLNLVPCILVDEDLKGPIKDGKLGNLAPTILQLMGVEKPEDMECESLLG